jgi:hypothetical protein
MTRRQIWCVMLALLGVAVAFPLLRITDGIVTRLYLGHPSPSPEDVGSMYVPPRGAETDAGEFGYVATAEREAQIIAGFRKLSVGESREDVREAMGPPDVVEPMRSKEYNMPFIGWHYLYEIKMRRGPPNTNNVYASVFFSPDGTLHWAVPNQVAGLDEVGSYRN